MRQSAVLTELNTTSKTSTSIIQPSVCDEVSKNNKTNITSNFINVWKYSLTVFSRISEIQTYRCAPRCSGGGGGRGALRRVLLNERAKREQILITSTKQQVYQLVTGTCYPRQRKFLLLSLPFQR